MLVAQNSLGPVCPVPLTVRGKIRPHLNYAEAQKYDATADTLEHMCAQLPPVGPMSRTDALDAGAARKEAYEEAA